MNRYASRKFLIAATSLVFAQWSLFEKMIDGQVWLKVVIAVVGLYSAANVAQKVAAKTGSATESAQ